MGGVQRSPEVFGCARERKSESVCEREIVKERAREGWGVGRERQG